MTTNACVLRKEERNSLISIPGGFLGYLALCKNLRQNIDAIDEKAIKKQSDLPFVSSIIEESTPQGAIHIHWSFLKY